MTLTEFLTARIDEDEGVARRVASHTQYVPPKSIGGIPRLGIIGYPTARVLAECAAKRAIMARHNAASSLQLLALPYADHEDYDEAWRP